MLAPIRPYVNAVLYTMVGCACRVKLRRREWSFPFPIVLLFVVVLRTRGILFWAQYVRTCSTKPFTMHGWFCLPCGIADDKASCLLLFDHYE